MAKVNFYNMSSIFETLMYASRYYKDNDNNNNPSQTSLMSFETLENSLIKRELFNDITLKNKIKLAMKMQKIIIDAMNLKKEDIIFYFHYIPSINMNIAELLLLSYVDYSLDSFEEIYTKACQLLAKNGLHLFLHTCKSNELLIDEDMILDDEKFDATAWLLKCNELSMQEKWIFIEICFDIKKHVLHILEIIKPGIDAINNNMNSMKKHIIKFDNYLKSIEINKEFFMRICIDIDLKSYSKVTLIPSFALLNGVSISNMQISIKNELVIFIGVLLDDEFYHVENLFQKDELCKAMKLLADPSKFEIIRLLKDKMLYGQELCEKLNLSKATISHHINVLINYNLVKAKISKNRTYYILDKEHLEKIFSEIENELLK